MRIKLFGHTIDIEIDVEINKEKKVEQFFFESMVNTIANHINQKPYQVENKIHAIKIYREWFHRFEKPVPSLLQAKLFVESLIKGDNNE